MSRTQVTNGEAAPKTLTKSTSDIAKSGAEILAQGKAASPFKQPLPERTRREVRKEQAVKSHWKPISKGTQARLKENQSLLERVVSGRTFEILSCILVVANAVTIGIDTQVVAWERQVSPQTWVEPSFTFLFTVELILRMMSLKRTFFESAWNGFDFLVVVVMLTEQVLNTVHDLQADFLSQMSMLRILRIVRIIRVFRVIRMLKFFRELRMMIQSILASFVSLLWAMLVLGLLFYIFGIALCQGAVEHLMSDEVNPDELMAMKLDEKFGSLDKSWLSLYEAMAGGISWGELVDVLTPMNKVYTLVFLLFITFAIFGVVNIVTGVFVDTALQNSKSDRETLIQDELHEKQRVIKEIKDMFQEMDTSGDGIVGIEEFQVAVEDDRMVAYFNALELDISDIHGLFVLLDRDHQGAIDIEEFVTGCMRLRGEARTIDLAKMMLESEYTMHNVEVMVDALQVLFDALGVQEAVRTRSSPFEITGADESGAAQASRDPLALPYSSSKSFDKQPLD